MTVDSILNNTLEDRGDPRDWSRPSRAVIAFSGVNDSGIVLWYVGPHIETQYECVGSVNVEELGFDFSPATVPCMMMGIWIWEGKLVGGHRIETLDGTDYTDTELKGILRAPTGEEWDAIKLDNNPWDPDDWILPGYCKLCYEAVPEGHVCTCVNL